MSLLSLVLSFTTAVLAVLLIARERAGRAAIEDLRHQLAATGARLKEQQEMGAVGQAVSGLTEELRSTLQGALGNTELMLATGTLNPATEEFRDMQENVERAAGLVRNLSAFTETVSLSRRWQDLNEIVARGVADRRHQLAGAGVEITVRASGRLPLVYVDGRQLEKVIATLLTHPAPAVRGSDFRPARPATLTTTRDHAPDGHLVVELDELALEIPDESTWSVDLAACRRIVEAHGGALAVEAKVGKGFRFRLELPVTPVGGGVPSVA